MYKDDFRFPDFMNSATFWMNDITDEKEVILSVDEIEKFNIHLQPLIPSLYPLDKEEGFISSNILTDYIQSYKLPSKDMYDSNEQLIQKDFYEKIIDNTNLNGIKHQNMVKYGISIRKTSIRSFPADKEVYSCTQHVNINNFDRFQETGCFPFEIVLILHQSVDEKWYFVKLYNYFGWVKADDIAVAQEKQDLFNYANCSDFLMVTGKEATLNFNEKDSSSINIRCGMGTKLCCINPTESSLMENYMVKLPTRNISGNLLFKNAIISKNEDIIMGYLSYTRYNIINQVLKFTDTYYDWGDKFSGKDCSSLMLTIYKCFGFLLPRNASDQENSFFNTNNSIVFNKDDTLNTRFTIMDKLKPGAALFMPGHVMMYLGKYKDNYYMIHSFAGYGVKKENFYEARSAMLVAISLVDLPTAEGIPFIQRFTSAVHYE